MAVKHARNFDTPYGRFSYLFISRDSFHIGVRSINNGDYAFLMASPEKALCDLIANTAGLNLRYIKEARKYLDEDIRFDMDNFKKLDSSVFEEYAKVGKKGDSIKTIIKLLKDEQ